ncbi:MAG TPA: winged helix-turn-helix domain-containing protein [Thermoanaerobaculia bacterium]|nr:winged helix-turn-helix domain-containing protein [Thermoanaerobaculia bacterium]
MRGEQILEFDGFTVDLGSRLLLRDDRPVALTPKAFETLAVLLEHPGEVLGKEALLSRVWPGAFVEEGILTQNIYTLRKALQEAGGARTYIETIPRRGYRFAGPVAIRGGAPQPDAEARIASLAVLPFEPLAGNTDDAYLGLGLADSLITRLSNLRRIAVRPTSAVRRYLGMAREPAAVGRLLQVDAVLDGTIRRAGDWLRIGVQLVSVRDDAPLWATQFDARAADLFALEDKISQELAEELRLRLSRQERDRLTRSATRHPEAYDAYLRGRYFWNRRTFEGLSKGIELFRRAIDLDPDFALAYAGLADCRVLLSLHGAVAPRDAFPPAIAAAERALELDDSLAEAHTSLAYARFMYERRWEEAERGFRRALEISPGYATAHQWYSFLLAALGRHAEAIAQARQARELDPLSLVINSDLGMVLCFARDPAAEEQLRRTLELDPSFAYARFELGVALQQQGRLDEAVAELRLASSMAPDSPVMQAALGQVLARAGRTEEARTILAVLEDRATREPVEASLFAFLWTGLGERERAIDCLEEACREGSRFVAFLATWSIYDPLRDHPRWPALLRRAGLSPADSAAALE